MHPTAGVQLERVKDDFDAWLLWMDDVVDTETKSTWYSWNKEQVRGWNRESDRGAALMARLPTHHPPSLPANHCTCCCTPEDLPACLQLEPMRNEKRNQTNPSAGALRGILSSMPTAILAVAAISQLDNGGTKLNKYSKWIIAAVVSGCFWLLIFVVFWLRRLLVERHRAYRWWRLVRSLSIVIVLGGLVRTKEG
jgi:hypothetical protein